MDKVRLFLVSLFVISFSEIVKGEDFTIGNLQYNISWDNTSVTVSKADDVSLTGELVIPETVKYGGVTYSVKYIGWNGFSNTDVTSVKLPNSIIELNAFCFEGCSRLEKINLPQNVTYLGYGLFNGCTSLAYIESHIYYPFDIIDNMTFNESVLLNTVLQVPTGSINRYKTSIGWKDFSSIIEIEMDDIDKNVLKYTIVDSNNVSVAANCPQIDGDIVIPNEVVIDGETYAVKQIENNGFENCTKIRSISLPSTIKSIGWWAFAYTNLMNIVLPEGLEDIGSWAFHGCSKLEKILIPQNVSSFGWGVFSGDCHNLTTITVEEGNQYLKEKDGILLTKDGTVMLAYAFGNPNENLVIPETVTSLNVCALFKENKRLKTITISPRVKYIGGDTFNGCTSLVNVVLPDGINEIGYTAFYGCTSLETITIPANLSKITDGYVFSGCTSVKSVVVRQNSPMNISEQLFDETTYNNATLYVPKGRLKYYQNASVWNKFSSIEEIDMPGIEPSNDPFDNLKDNQMILGHYTSSEHEDEYGYGGMEIGTYKAAVHYDSYRMNAFKSVHIQTVRFALVETENISNFKIWIGNNRDNPLYTQNHYCPLKIAKRSLK